VIGDSWTTLEINLSWASPFRNTYNPSVNHRQTDRQNNKFNFISPVLLITEFKRQIVAVHRSRRDVGNVGQVDGSFDTLHFADDAADLQFHAGTPADHHLFRFVLNVTREKSKFQIKTRSKELISWSHAL
jgi:hypothetical protein